ncbi:hypothetical protein F4678DRAFT_435086 [Xylaria arbuscula]|nr:hypothetical protein F4678DRAFT_435086 [Xylaria arbuscula]
MMASGHDEAAANFKLSQFIPTPSFMYLLSTGQVLDQITILSTVMAQSLPQSYQRAVFKALSSDLVLEEVPLKLPGPGEILVKRRNLPLGRIRTRERL